jgi:hypothetical protein
MLVHGYLSNDVDVLQVAAAPITALAACAWPGNNRVPGRTTKWGRKTFSRVENTFAMTDFILL